MFGPALALVAASYTGCSAPLTVSLVSLGVGLMGGTMSGYRINHLDISPRFAGILMSLTNCIANVFALLAPLVAGFIIEGKVLHPEQWVLGWSTGCFRVYRTGEWVAYRPAWARGTREERGPAQPPLTRVKR